MHFNVLRSFFSLRKNIAMPFRWLVRWVGWPYLFYLVSPRGGLDFTKKFTKFTKFKIFCPAWVIFRSNIRMWNFIDSVDCHCNITIFWRFSDCRRDFMKVEQYDITKTTLMNCKDECFLKFSLVINPDPSQLSLMKIYEIIHLYIRVDTM